MAVTIYTPVEGFTGVVAGVAFDDGQGTVDELSPSQRLYFRQQGYGIGQPASPAPVPVAARPGPPVHVGTRLQDAAETVTTAAAGDFDVQSTTPGDEGDAEPGQPLERPKVRDPINVWRTWAIKAGHDPDGVAEATKEELQQLPDTPASKET